MAASIEDIIRRVQALLAQADHPNTSPTEAETFRVKAEAMMMKYRLDAAELGETQQVAAGPVWRSMPFAPCGGEFHSHYWHILIECTAHLDVRYSYHTEVIEGKAWYVADLVGYEGDLGFAMMLVTEFMLAFSKRLEPKYDSTLSDQVNAYLMRSAGMEGRRIAMAIYGRDDKGLRPKVRAMFKAEALARGEDPAALLGQGNTMKVYRRSYADGFAISVGDILWRMRNSNDDKSALVLKSRKEAVNEAFYERHPDRRPRPAAGAIGDGYEGCPKCKKAKSGMCRDHSWRKPKERKVNSGAYYRGEAAAREVRVGNSKQGELS